MSYPKQLLRLQPTKGVIKDVAASEVGPDFYTDARNVIFRQGFAERIGGNRDAYTTALGIVNPTNLIHAINTELADTNYWLLFEADGSAWAVEGTNATPIDAAILQATAVSEPWRYSSTRLNGVPVVSNSQDEPVYWIGANLATLPDWTATESCQFITAFKFHLFALNIDGPGGTFENLVKWSSAAEPGTVPNSWTPAPDNDAGSAELSDSPGGLVCAYPLRDSLMIYKRSATYQCQFIGGNAVFNFRKAMSSSGALTANSVCDVNGRHFIVSDGDVLLSDGTNIQSIGESRIKDFLFNQLDQTNYLNLFCTYNRAQDEVIVGFPSSGNTFCDLALVYDVTQNSFGIREMPLVRHAPVGFVNDDIASNVWANRTDTWQQANDLWGSSNLQAARDSLLFVRETVLEEQDTLDNVSRDAVVGKQGLTFGEPERIKFVRRVHVRAENYGILYVRVGSQMVPGGPVDWSPEVTLTYPQQIINTFAQGRYIAVEVRSDNGNIWTLNAIELEAELRGYH